MKTRHHSFSSSSRVAALALAVSACGNGAAVDSQDAGGGSDEAALVSDDRADADAGLVRCRVDEDDDGVLRFDELGTHTLTTTDECALLDGFVADLNASTSTMVTATSGGGSSTTVLTTERLPGWVGRFIRDTGIPKRRYVPTTYDCDDFASDAERALDGKAAGLGTFTVLFCSTLKDGLVDPSAGNYLPHAITDVHVDGRTSWVEPQTGDEFDVDVNGDGKVKVRDGKYSSSDVFVPTETTKDGRYGCSVYVYNDRAAAEAAGWKLD